MSKEDTKRIAVAVAANNDNQNQLKFSTMLSIKETAKMLGISYSTLHRLVNAGKILQVQISPGRRVIPLEAAEAYVNQCYQQAA